MSVGNKSNNASAGKRSGAQLMTTTLAAGTCAVVSIFLVFAFFYDAAQRDLRRQEINNYLSTVGDSMAWGVSNWLAERTSLTETIAHEITSANDGGNHTAHLKSPVYEQTFIWTYYGETDGSYYIWPADDELPDDYDPRMRPWYQAAIAAGDSTFTEPYFDIATNVETITVVTPVLKDGKLQGVVGADFSTETLAKVLNQTDLGGLGYVFLVNRTGDIMGHPNRALVSSSLADVYGAQIPKIDESIQEVTNNQSSEILHFIQIPSENGAEWYLGVSINSAKAYAGLRGFRMSAAIAALAATLLMICVLGFVVHRMLVKPLLAARRAADAASAAKSEFLASMSHEIRTPMNGVLGMAEVLSNTDLDKHQKELASIIVSSGGALMTVINDILDFSKLEVGKLRLTPQSFNLRQMVYDVTTMMQARALEKDLELVVRYAPNLPEGVIADDSRLRQVLGNLIGNAVKFTEHGYVLVDVSGERVGDNLNLNVSVTDTGIGIANDQIEKIFGKFEQADASHTRRFGGTGLGLAICKNIVELMGGEIGTQSELGRGARFWFTVSLPADDKVKAMPAVKNDIFDGARILAVDDNTVNQRVIQELMNGWKLRSTVVDNSQGAMDALARSAAENDSYHVILMDYQMPNEDGVSLTRRIQSDPRFADIPVIMLSSVDTAPHTEIEDVKFAASLAKPIRPSQLMDLLSRVLLDGANSALKATAEVMRTKSASPEKPKLHDDDRIRLVVAEDNVVNQLVVKNMIDATKYDIALAENGALAVEMFKKHMPLLVLMDISMPVMDGLEATRQIRRFEAERNLPRTPIVAVTAHVLEEDQDRCRLAGMDGFIAKPLRKPILDETLTRWVDGAISWDDVESA